MIQSVSPILFVCLLWSAQSVQAVSILSGPVITHLSAREAKIWIEWETAPKDALIRYSNPAESDSKFAAQVIVGNDGISNTILDQINPGRSYQYVVEADGERLIEEFRRSTRLNSSHPSRSRMPSSA